MALNKQNLTINFAQGLETKTDPFQVAPGKMLTLANSVFGKGGALQKRNGFAQLPSLPTTESRHATTFKDNLVAISSELYSYNSGSASWVSKGSLQPAQIDVLPLIRAATNQSQCDAAVSSNGLVCTVYTDVGPSGTSYKYAVADSVTGQNVVNPTDITPTAGVVSGTPRVFVVGSKFVIVFTVLISATSHLQFMAVSSYNPQTVTAAQDIANTYTPSTNTAWDGVVANDTLYIAYNGSDLGGAVHVTYIDSTLTQHNVVDFASEVGKIFTLCADITGTTANIYVNYFNNLTTNCRVIILDHVLNTLVSPATTVSGVTVSNLASAAQNGACTLMYEVPNTYTYDTSISTNYIRKVSITQAGSVGTPATVIRSLGLASKAFIYNSKIYALGAYSSDYQPTYFLIDSDGNTVVKLAYQNAGGYVTKGLPNASIVNDTVYLPYLFKDLVVPVNKSQGVPNTAGVYSQLGINLLQLNLNSAATYSAEIGNNLNLTGGFLWSFDGYMPVEQGFHLYPDYIETATSTTGGSMPAQQYYYYVTYEWSDAQGNVFRSAPSVPTVAVTSTGASSVTVNIPTLRLTYKIDNPVKIVVYRWSVAQQTAYQITSVTSPLLNDTTIDYVSYVDTQDDTDIVGNSILYTTGGVVENISPPAVSAMTLFKSRLVAVDSENKNLLWYSKQVIEGTPVEMSDLLTIFVAPTTAAQGSTGPITALSAMDDKLIIFKKDAIYYITGTGPDNTGINNDFSEPVFITSTVGSTNKNSIVFTPNGLMFQSDKGIWLLGRDLSTQYIGAPVEAFNNDVVVSAVNVPGTNQVRFNLTTGTVLMYDYYFNQWGTFTGIPGVSSCLYQGLHTFINDLGQLFQESLGSYQDGSNPVLMSFTTAWMSLAGLQGYERAYYFYVLATYLSPHKLSVKIAYDYNPNASQIVTITPDNYNNPWGGEALWGSGNQWGGNSQVEQWRVFMKQQKCQSFQLSVTEIFDPSYGTLPGAGFTMSGLDLIVGIKKGYPAIRSSRSVG